MTLQSKSDPNVIALKQAAEIRVLADPTKGSYTKSNGLIWAMLQAKKDSSASKQVGAW